MKKLEPKEEETALNARVAAINLLEGMIVWWSLNTLDWRPTLFVAIPTLVGNVVPNSTWPVHNSMPRLVVVVVEEIGLLLLADTVVVVVVDNTSISHSEDNTMCQCLSQMREF